MTEQSKEVESGYEYARDMLIDCANNNYTLVKDLAEQYCDRILEEGKRLAREEKDYPCKVCEHKDIAYETGRSQGRELRQAEIKSVIFGLHLGSVGDDIIDAIEQDGMKLVAIDSLIKEPKGEGK